MTRVNGAALPVMEMQSRWVARVLSAGCTLPQHSHMEAWVNKRNTVLKTDKRRTVVSCVELICNMYEKANVTRKKKIFFINTFPKDIEKIFIFF